MFPGTNLTAITDKKCGWCKTRRDIGENWRTEQECQERTHLHFHTNGQAETLKEETWRQTGTAKLVLASVGSILPCSQFVIKELFHSF